MATGSQNMTTYLSKQVIGANSAHNPAGALLQSGTGRADNSTTGDTWIFLDTIGGTTSPWGFKHSQGDNGIKFFGGGNHRSTIWLGESKITATTFEGNASTATVASKLTTSNVGGARQPIYLAAGVATAANYTVAHFGNAGKSNMNDVGRLHASTGMTNLSSTSNADTPQCGDTYRTGWHLYWSTNYSDDPNGTNAWVAQIVNRAGTSEWWVRSRNGGTITNGTAWASSWRHLVTSAQAGVGGAGTPVYISNTGEATACTAANLFNTIRDNGGDTRWVNATGDTMSGSLTLNSGKIAFVGTLGQFSSTAADDIGGLTWQNHDGGPSSTVNANDGPTSAWWYILRNKHTNTGNNYYTDLAIPFNHNSIYYKIIRNGSIANSGWVRVLDALNYNDYAPTKTGGGASGKWSINITGHADSDLALSGGDMTGSIRQKMTSVTRGSSPSANQYRTYEWIDSGNKRVAQVEYGMLTNGESRLHLYVLGNNTTSTGDEYSGIIIYKKVGVSGNVSATYNANNGTFSATTFSGALNGNAATATSASKITIAGGTGGTYYKLIGVPSYASGAQDVYVSSPAEVNNTTLRCSHIAATAGYLTSTLNGNTVQIGSQNGSFAHFTNTKDIPFWFNKVIQSDGGFTIYNTGANHWRNGHLQVNKSDGGDCYIEICRAANADWRILNSNGYLYFQSNWTSAKGSYFTVLQLDYNTGRAHFKEYVYASYFNASCGAETPADGSYWIFANSDGFFRKSTRANLAAKIDIEHKWVRLGGDTMTGSLKFSKDSPLTFVYTAGTETPVLILNGAVNYGMRYKEGTPDTLKLSASGNANTDNADLCINGKGDGTVTIRGNIILHAGNYTSYTTAKGTGLAYTTLLNQTYAGTSYKTITVSNISSYNALHFACYFPSWWRGSMLIPISEFKSHGVTIFFMINGSTPEYANFKYISDTSIQISTDYGHSLVFRIWGAKTS